MLLSATSPQHENRMNGETCTILLLFLPGIR